LTNITIRLPVNKGMVVSITTHYGLDGLGSYLRTFDASNCNFVSQPLDNSPATPHHVGDIVKYLGYPSYSVGLL